MLCFVVHVLHSQLAWPSVHGSLVLSLLFLTQGMMGAYGPPFMPMQGPPPEGMMGMGGVPPHPMGVPMPLSHQHQLPAGMPGYPGMPHPGKEQKLPARSSPVTLLSDGLCSPWWRGLKKKSCLVVSWPGMEESTCPKLKISAKQKKTAHSCRSREVHCMNLLIMITNSVWGSKYINY